MPVRSVNLILPGLGGTIVIIGSSTSRAFKRGSGTVAYTPRGYASKTAELAK